MTKWSCECCGGNRFDDLDRETKECWYCGTLYKKGRGALLSHNYQATLQNNIQQEGSYFTGMTSYFGGDVW